MSAAPVNPSPESLWYYADAANQPVGPLPFSTLQQLAAVGVIQPETHVIEKGGTEWVKFASVIPSPVRDKANQTGKGRALTKRVIIAWCLFWAGILVVLFYWLNRPTSHDSTPSEGKTAASRMSVPTPQATKLPESKTVRLDWWSKTFPANSPPPPPPPSKVGERRRLAPNSLVFADEQAYTEYMAAKEANDSAKLAEMDKNGRAFLCNISGQSVWIESVNGIAGLVQERHWVGNSRKEFWTSQGNLLLLAPQRIFQIGEEVEIAEYASLFTKPDLMQNLRKACSDDSAPRVTEAMSELDADGMRLSYRVRAKVLRAIVIQADNDERLYEVEGTLKDGSRLCRWVAAHSLKRYAAEAKASTEPTNSGVSQRTTGNEFTRRESDFLFTFKGGSGRNVNGVDVRLLPDMIAGIYTGQIPAGQASRYLFGGHSLEEGVEFVNVAGEYLIFKAVADSGDYEFAVKRDPDFEREAKKMYGSISAFYGEMQNTGAGYVGYPLTRKPIMVIGTKQFTTAGGLVKIVPVVEAVTIVR